MRIVTAAAIAVAIAGGPAAARGIVVIGDSIMDFNGDRSIPAVLARELATEVDDRAAAGAMIDGGPLGRLFGMDIRAQLGGDRPDILVMTGGGNDLGERCGCAEGCARQVDRLLTADGGGLLGAFLAEVVADGVRVVYLGYARPPEGGNEFSGCMPHLDVLAARLRRFPAPPGALTFVAVTDLIDPGDPRLYDADGVHPSPEAGARMAAAIADAIRNLP